MSIKFYSKCGVAIERSAICLLLLMPSLPRHEQNRLDVDARSAARTTDRTEIPDFFEYSVSECMRASIAKSQSAEKECEGDFGVLREEISLLKHGSEYIPIVKVYAKDRRQNIDFQNVIFYIDGGPLHRYPRITDFLNPYSDLDINTIVIFPIYRGTWFRSSGNAVEDLKVANVELDFALNHYRKIYKSSAFNIVGESWGGVFCWTSENQS